MKADFESIEISSDQKSYQLSVGDRLWYKAKIHGSVGFQANVIIRNSDVIEKISAVFAYNNAQVPRTTGGDGGNRTYIFEAKQIGTTEITMQKLFRGKLENEFTVEINVAEL